jgi:hypothetical protein
MRRTARGVLSSVYHIFVFFERLRVIRASIVIAHIELVVRHDVGGVGLCKVTWMGGTVWLCLKGC